MSNPLEQAAERVQGRGDDTEFDPKTEIGCSDEELLDFLSTEVGHYLSTKEMKEEGDERVIALEVEDLAYFLTVGICIGVEMERGEK